MVLESGVSISHEDCGDIHTPISCNFFFLAIKLLGPYNVWAYISKILVALPPPAPSIDASGSRYTVYRR